MGPTELVTRVIPAGDWRGGSPSTSSNLDKRTSDLALSNDEDFDTGHQVPPPFTLYHAHSTINVIQKNIVSTVVNTLFGCFKIT
ncbi:hypothetical protein B7P43_G14582 [Cryptotermes secundus]|uniref:Uncharacterized protein n=1 Tax=Cryptotermes secundus TaxID=105785 RepID=A0A2J7PDZ8_9NEOP|nr:hypothetical protein B7P43_G14582 [Cryptotermes secundus]